MSPKQVNVVATKDFKRRETMERMDLGRSGPLCTNIRICDEHEYEEVAKSYTVVYFETIPKKPSRNGEPNARSSFFPSRLENADLNYQQHQLTRAVFPTDSLFACYGSQRKQLLLMARRLLRGNSFHNSLQKKAIRRHLQEFKSTRRFDKKPS
jgi:hypothetical protein